jgi:hypothetical protein
MTGGDSILFTPTLSILTSNTMKILLQISFTFLKQKTNKQKIMEIVYQLPFPEGSLPMPCNNDEDQHDRLSEK